MAGETGGGVNVRGEGRGGEGRGGEGRGGEGRGGEGVGEGGGEGKGGEERGGRRGVHRCSDPMHCPVIALQMIYVSSLQQPEPKLQLSFFTELCRKGECYISVIPLPVKAAVLRHSGIIAHDSDSAIRHMIVIPPRPVKDYHKYPYS